jgi:hypothetical protein
LHHCPIAHLFSNPNVLIKYDICLTADKSVVFLFVVSLIIKQTLNQVLASYSCPVELLCITVGELLEVMKWSLFGTAKFQKAKLCQARWRNFETQWGSVSSTRTMLRNALLL